jgi:hypothetical protein
MAVQTARHGGGLDAAGALGLGNHAAFAAIRTPRLSQRL